METKQSTETEDRRPVELYLTGLLREVDAVLHLHEHSGRYTEITAQAREQIRKTLVWWEEERFPGFGRQGTSGAPAAHI